MPCPKETVVMMFFNISSSFHFLFLFFCFSSILLFRFLCSLRRTDDDDEEEEDHALFTVECRERDALVADIIHGREAIKSTQKDMLSFEESLDSEGSVYEDTNETFEEMPIFNSPAPEPGCKAEDVVQEKLLTRDTESNGGSTEELTTPMETYPNENGSVADDSSYEKFYDKREAKMDEHFSHDENFFIFAPTQLETKKLQAKAIDEDIFGDSFTVGSTSKSSSEWRSSMLCRDSVTEDPFSSSSRRSCPNWESYAVFPKYDEEMMFFDRISAQKLSETESLRSIQVCPRSISERIVHKLTTRNRRSREITRNPYQELENAYVAQICLAWEALNWNYKNFQRLRASGPEEDPGCPGRIAQQFQQFQVLLQRYIENEPYEHGRRPEVYARLRNSAPNLLQVPEFRDSEDEQKEEGFGSRISSAKFLRIMEDGIRTFMNFLQSDREKPCQILTAFFRRKKCNSVDPTHLHMVKKANRKKKMKLKSLSHSKKCLIKKKLKEEDQTEILKGLIDLKVVSRVLRMSDISEEQLHWCEEKMSKVRLWEGKLQRDSSPLFFPAH
ncbi:hypothetical protein NE237_006547 [Protea cynaroides]|uniref:Ribosomal protein L34Ae n=1 Tax=Protea cynaroides TaxID=273540 RepID=A0A9Q0KML5_9MAGN|nr:hypothetical protein NE237_006547 [Protea cynaroides]